MKYAYSYKRNGNLHIEAVGFMPTLGPTVLKRFELHDDGSLIELDQPARPSGEPYVINASAFDGMTQERQVGSGAMWTSEAIVGFPHQDQLIVVRDKPVKPTPEQIALFAVWNGVDESARVVFEDYIDTICAAFREEGLLVEDNHEPT